MIGITRQLPRIFHPASVLRYRSITTRQLHQSPIISLFGKSKSGEKVGSGRVGSGGSGVGSNVGDGVGNNQGNITVENHPILKKMPRFMLPYTRNFIHAPVSHVTAFLILHELSAIVPLVGIWYVFHKYQWSIPLDLPSWAIDKGTHIIDKSMAQFDFQNFSLQEKANFIMEGAYAYVIVKGLFPVRILFSVLFMPSFAKYFVIPFTRIFSFRKKKQPKKQEIVAKEGSDVTQKKVTKPRL